MEYTINAKFESIEIKDVDVNIVPFKLARKADIHIRYVTEEFIKDLYNKLGIELKLRTMGGKKYYVLDIDSSPTNITFWIN